MKYYQGTHYTTTKNWDKHTIFLFIAQIKQGNNYSDCAIFNIIDAPYYINDAWQALTLLHFSYDGK